MDWASLSAFVAVADHGGFSAAAGQLHLTQPAISKRIALLEASLQARLFDRLGRQVVLTEAGRLLLPRARQMLAEAEAARRAGVKIVLIRWTAFIVCSGLAVVAGLYLLLTA